MAVRQHRGGRGSVPCSGTGCPGMQNASCPYRRCKTCCTNLSPEDKARIASGAKCNPHKPRPVKSSSIPSTGTVMSAQSSQSGTTPTTLITPNIPEPSSAPSDLFAPDATPAPPLTESTHANPVVTRTEVTDYWLKARQGSVRRQEDINAKRKRELEVVQQQSQRGLSVLAWSMADTPSVCMNPVIAPCYPDFHVCDHERLFSYLCPSGDRKAPVHIYHPASGKWHVVDADVFRRIEPYEDQLLLCGLPDGLASAATFNVNKYPGLSEEISSLQHHLPTTPRKRARFSDTFDPACRSHSPSIPSSPATLPSPIPCLPGLSASPSIQPSQYNHNAPPGNSTVAPNLTTPSTVLPPILEDGVVDAHAPGPQPPMVSLPSLAELESELPPARRAFNPRHYNGKISWPCTYMFRDIFCGFIRFHVLSQIKAPTLTRHDKLSRVWPTQEWSESKRCSGFDKARTVLGSGSPLLWAFMLANKNMYWGDYSVRVHHDKSKLLRLPWADELRDEMKESMIRIRPFWDDEIKKAMNDLNIDLNKLANELDEDLPPGDGTRLKDTQSESQCSSDDLSPTMQLRDIPSSPSYHPSDWSPSSNCSSPHDLPSSPSYHPSVWSPGSACRSGTISTISTPSGPSSSLFTEANMDKQWLDVRAPSPSPQPRSHDSMHGHSHSLFPFDMHLSASILSQEANNDGQPNNDGQLAQYGSLSMQQLLDYNPMPAQADGKTINFGPIQDTIHPQTDVQTTECLESDDEAFLWLSRFFTSQE
ncbi:hypothetical protein K474DRAFT_462160 [Panus rudis PR-1116 ss-1]|nr:hypothetical protein K474DRAFT_462160 [Panus rudis PR-1116 ss-1]